jgi:hypothetical protein
MFDTATRQICQVRLSPTASPLHALTMMNDPTWVEAARALAQRAWHGGKDDAERMALAFQLVLGRKPEKREAAMINVMVASQLAVYEANPKAAGELLAVGTASRDGSIPVVAHAALTAACLGLLNLDAAQTRD